MANVRVGPKFVAPQPEESGARTITVSVFGGDDVDVVFSEAEAVRLVRMFQEGFVDRWEKRTVHPNYPVMTILDANIAHGSEASGLLVETAEIGSLVLTFDPSIAEKLKSEIERTVEANSARSRNG